MSIAVTNNVERRRFITGLVTAASAIGLGVLCFTVTGCPSNAQVNSWIATAEKDTPVIKSVLLSVVGIATVATGNGEFAAPALALVNTAVNASTAALATIQTLLADYSAAPNADTLTKLDAALGDVQTNLSKILSSIPGYSVSPAIASSISAGLSLAVTVISSIQLLIPSSKVSLLANSTGTPHAPVKLMAPEDIKSQYNNVIRAHGLEAKFEVK
jgi:hypothetical protein